MQNPFPFRWVLTTILQGSPTENKKNRQRRQRGRRHSAVTRSIQHVSYVYVNVTVVHTYNSFSVSSYWLHATLGVTCNYSIIPAFMFLVHWFLTSNCYYSACPVSFIVKKKRELRYSVFNESFNVLLFYIIIVVLGIMQ